MYSAKNDWYFPDAFLPDIADQISHESVCVLNLTEGDAHMQMTFYYENQEPVGGYSAICPALRTNHIRLDKLKGSDGSGVPQCIPYSIHLSSDVPVLCQYTRLDATKPSYTLMTTMGL